MPLSGWEGNCRSGIKDFSSLTTYGVKAAKGDKPSSDSPVEIWRHYFIFLSFYGSFQNAILCYYSKLRLTSTFGARPQSHSSPSSTIPFPHCSLMYVSGTLSRQMPIPRDRDSTNCVLEHSDHCVDRINPLHYNRHTHQFIDSHNKQHKNETAVSQRAHVTGCAESGITNRPT